MALKYCHDQQILHGDIKSSNVFISEESTLKLGDFGTATNLANTVKNVNSMTGTPLFFAPEIIKGNPHSFKADVWALGVAFYQLLALKYPFYDCNFAGLLTKILEEVPAGLPDVYSQEIRDFVMSFLQKDETDRPDMQAIFESSFFQNSLLRFPKEAEIASAFQPQIKLRITENFLQKEFDAIRVFRFSENQSAQSSFRCSTSKSNSFFDIFQLNCIGENDPKRTEKMLSKFAQQSCLSQSVEFSEESDCSDEVDFFVNEKQRKSKKSTNTSDKVVQVNEQRPLPKKSHFQENCQPIDRTPVNNQPTKIQPKARGNYSVFKPLFAPVKLGKKNQLVSKVNSKAIICQNKKIPIKKTTTVEFAHLSFPKVYRGISSDVNIQSQTKTANLPFKPLVCKKSALSKTPAKTRLPQPIGRQRIISTHSKGVLTNVPTTKSMSCTSENVTHRSYNFPQKLEHVKESFAFSSELFLKNNSLKNKGLGKKPLSSFDSNVGRILVELGAQAIHKKLDEGYERLSDFDEYMMGNAPSQRLTHQIVEQVKNNFLVKR